MDVIFTIGYEGAALGDFIATLKLVGISHVLDVREVPQSRRAGFSKKLLAVALAESGISYSHSKQLGDPKPGRDAARSGDFAKFRSIFEAHLALPQTVAELHKAIEIAKAQPTVMLCFERDPKQCHRSIVAARIKAVSSLEVQHIGVRHDAARFIGGLSRAA